MGERNKIFEMAKPFIGLLLITTAINIRDPATLDTLLPIQMNTLRNFFTFILSAGVFLYGGWVIMMLIEIPVEYIINKLKEEKKNG